MANDIFEQLVVLSVWRLQWIQKLCHKSRHNGLRQVRNKGGKRSMDGQKRHLRETKTVLLTGDDVIMFPRGFECVKETK